MPNSAKARADGRPIEIDIPSPPLPDQATVTPEGERLETLIDGVRVRPAKVQLDERGSLTEMYSEAWSFTDEPLRYVYQTTIRVGVVKGWVIHYEQDDRLFFDNGAVKVVLYDARAGSATYGAINELFFGSAKRALLRIPAGVFHAVANIGESEVRFVNLPTRPYRHERPDKARLPTDTDAIPYRF
jgi:dTDP-4-dehydrorhamnose 3,5-epimerase